MLKSSNTLRVAIDAQLYPRGAHGGVEQVAIGLVKALGQLSDDSIEYIIVCPWQDPTWLDSYIGPNQRVVVAPQPKITMAESTRNMVKQLKFISYPLRSIWRTYFSFRQKVTKPELIPPSDDGYYQSLGADLVHFLYPKFIRCQLPFIYTVYDLQHLHYPEFFPHRHILWRENAYRYGCNHAAAISVASSLVKTELAAHYALSLEKICATPLGAATDAYETLSTEQVDTTRSKYRLPDIFIFYPAQTWPHKNHIRLLEALAFLRRDRATTIRLVCTGYQNEHWSIIQSHIESLGLEHQVQFLGYIEPHELRAIYKLCQFVVFPTLFEGWGFPLFEAFREGVPIACSDIPIMREYAEGAALFFDAISVPQIANAIATLSSDPELRSHLQSSGERVVQHFSWSRTAQAFRDLYRQIG